MIYVPPETIIASRLQVVIYLFLLKYFKMNTNIEIHLKVNFWGGDVLAYEIVSTEIDEGVNVLCLAAESKPSFLEELGASPKTKERAALISRTTKRIHDFGIDWAFVSKTFKPLDKELSLCEMRVTGRVIRVMTYVHNNILPIYLFDFDGHQGKGNSIPPNYLERGKRLSIEAHKCMEKEGSEWSEKE